MNQTSVRIFVALNVTVDGPSTSCDDEFSLSF